MLSPFAAKSLLSYECIFDRLMVARFNSIHSKLTIIMCYASTNSETRSDNVANKYSFYNQLDDLTSSITWCSYSNWWYECSTWERYKHIWSPLFLETMQTVISLTTVSDDHIFFFKAHNLVVGSSLFPQKRIHKLTWNSPNGRTCNQPTRPYTSEPHMAELRESNHNLAISTIKLLLPASRRDKKRTPWPQEETMNRLDLALTKGTHKEKERKQSSTRWWVQRPRQADKS